MLTTTTRVNVIGKQVNGRVSDYLVHENMLAHTPDTTKHAGGSGLDNPVNIPHT